MKKINCDCCGKYLFSTNEKELGVIASKAHTAGYVVKMPVFFGVPKFKIFCCKSCCKKWFADNVEPEKIAEGNRNLKKLEEQKPQIISGLQNGIRKAINIFNQIKSLPPEERRRVLDELKKKYKKDGV